MDNTKAERIKQLKEQIEFLSTNAVQLDNGQTAVKILLNSLFGACGNRHFRYYAVEIAESITVTSQFVIRWAEKKINAYLNKLLKTDNVDYATYGDTDSVVGSTVIDINGSKISIADYFDSLPNNYIKKDDFNKNFVKTVSGDATLSISNNGELQRQKVVYAMKHTVKKEMFKITNSRGESVIVTQDHSIIVRNKRTGVISSIKPMELNREEHEIININADTDSMTKG